MADNPQFTGMQPLRPHIVGHMGPLPSSLPPMSMQFRPGVPPPPPPPFVPVAPQQFQPIGHLNMGMPLHAPAMQYPQSAPPPPPPLPPSQRPSVEHVPPQGPPPPPPDFQANRPVISAPAQPQISNNFMPGFGGPVISQHQPMYQTNIHNYSAGGQPWYPTVSQPWFSMANQNINHGSQRAGEPNSGAQQLVPSGNQNGPSNMPSGQTEEQSTGMVNSDKTLQTGPLEKASSYWREYTSHHGKKYYYNKKTKISSWEKPLELMTPTEKADASTDWREVTTTEGMKFYFNKVTKQSKWAIPEEVKMARQQANLSLYEGTLTVKDEYSYASSAVSDSGNHASTTDANNLSSVQNMVSSPVSVTPAVNPEPVEISCSSSIQEEVASVKVDTPGPQDPLETNTYAVPSDTSGHVTMAGAATPTLTSHDISSQEAAPPSVSGSEGVEDVNKSAGNSESGGTDAPEMKKAEPGPLVYESKEAAKNAFKGLLETTNVGPGWTWDQAMRVIINDKRYAALRTLGERKQAFNEFVGQKKKQEAEERRAKQKKAREDFKKMLEESKEMTSSTRWSKAISMFENDERFQAFERAKDREDVFSDYIEELKTKERAKAAEEHKRYKAEYLEFLKSCNFIKVSSQWRKVQTRLEADERCSRLEKIERLEIFQEYLRDLEKEEEEQRKLRMEELRKAERKNRDEFRKLMEEHVANGIITAKTLWRDYCTKVKDAPAYLAVFSNTGGSTAKDLFEDVVEDLEKQYADDKEQVEDTVKSEKISLSTSWTFEDFKSAISKEIGSKPISVINLKLIFEELLDKIKEKEEKEAKKRRRLSEDLSEFLLKHKEISASSKWEDCKPLVEERFVGDESFFRDIFDKVIVELKEKEKHKERKRKDEKAKKEKERKDKENKERERRKSKGVESRRTKDRRKREETDSDGSDSYSLEENRRSSRDRSRKHRKRRDSFDDTSSTDGENDQSMSRRHRTDSSKKSRRREKRSSTSEESQSKRHKEDH